MEPLQDTMLDQIGAEGTNVNDSFASSAMNVFPDQDRLIKYDTDWHHWQKTRSRHNKWLISLGILCLNLIVKGYLAMGGIGGLLLILWLLCRQSEEAELTKLSEYYAMGLLTPGIITEVSDEWIEVLVMAPMGHGDMPTVYGCKKLHLRPLPDTPLNIGEQVPCISVFYSHPDDEYYVDFTPRPVVWGYQEPEVIEKALEAIERDPDHEKDQCWQLLDELEERVDLRGINEICRFDKQLKRYDREP